MPSDHYFPIFQFTRGDIVESIQYGSIAVATSDNHYFAWYGNPQTVTFLRSTAKPFQALRFIESYGDRYYELNPEEISLICASHSGTDRHVAIVEKIQKKTGVKENDLLCGIHMPIDKQTAEALSKRGEKPTPNRNNCSGKHTGMLAFTRMRNIPYDPNQNPYIDPSHPIQKEIIAAFGQMCGLSPDDVHIGIDGCSVPNFAVPLHNAAFGYAQLCDPKNLPEERQRACRVIVNAMTTNPFMVGGPDSFDTILMEVTKGKIVSKGGAEGYQGIGILPGVTAPASPGIGITIKIADGDYRNHARPAVTLEILRKLKALTEEEQRQLSNFGPVFPLTNHRKVIVGQASPTFELQYS
jgi:L-asparaginase II